MTKIAIYFPIHFLGIFLLFLCLGALCTRERREGGPSSRKVLCSVHILAIVLTIVGGMGVMTGFGYANDGMPSWIVVKLGIWVAIGLGSLLVYRYQKYCAWFFASFCLLGAAAALSARFKSIEIYTAFFG